ncbi:MAG: cytochrome c oxidase subunit II [Alphaproteobacteria bacterium]
MKQFRGARWAGLTALAGLAGLVLAPGAASAAQPHPWQLGFQEAATPLMESVVSFHNLLLVIISVITAFVALLMLYVVIRYNSRTNREPTRTSHNTVLEILWTAVPVLILLVIAIPSFRLLFQSDIIPEADMTVKATGHQWYWSYEYPDHGAFAFDAFLVEDEDLQPGQPRLLATDNHIVVPVGAVVRLQVTASDVLHAWAVPAFGVKIDAVPGRLNETWFQVTEPGLYYGQCSELCGVRHGYMPITVEAVSPAAFDAWVAETQARLLPAESLPDDADTDAAVRLASNN